jgi:parallel beta-helix repeat protein
MCNGTYNGGLTLINETVNGIQTHDMWRDMGLDPNSPSGKVLASIMKEEVWNATAIDFNDSGSMGEKLNAAGTAGDPWTTSLAGYTTPGTAGHTIRTKLNLDVKAVADIIASKDTFKSWQGKVIYVKPTTGSDTTGDGSRDLPYKTITKALTLATDHGHDLIYVLNDASGGRTTINEQVTISKADVMIRGPGRDVLWTSTNPGDVVTINGVHGIEISGFEFTTATTGVGNAITVNGGRSFHIHDNLFTYARASAVKVVGASSFGMIERNTIHGTGKFAAANAIDIDGTLGVCEHNIIEWNTVVESTGDAISLKNNKCEDTIVRNNVLVGNTEYGLHIDAAVRTTVYDNTFSVNGLGPFLDTGTFTTIQNNDQWSTLTTNDIPTAIENADAVRTELTTELSQIMVLPSAVENADAVRTELTTELSHLMTLQNGMGLDSTQATMLLEIYRLYGLDPAKPLVVAQTSRTAGAEIQQSISELAGVVTVTRQ